MNTDIRLRVGVFQHPKVLKLRRKLGDAAAVCLLELWLYTTVNAAEDGLLRLDEDELEMVARWDGEEGQFAQALIKLNLVDQVEGGFEVHDWSEHNTWQTGVKVRSERAKKASMARWGKQPKAREEDDEDAQASSPSNAQAMPKHDAPGMLEHDAPLLSSPLLSKKKEESPPPPPPGEMSTEVSADDKPQSVIDEWNRVAKPKKWRTTTGQPDTRRKIASALRRPEFRKGWRKNLQKLDELGIPWIGKGKNPNWVPNIKWFIRSSTQEDIIEDGYWRDGSSANGCVTSQSDAERKRRVEKAMKLGGFAEGVTANGTCPVGH